MIRPLVIAYKKSLVHHISLWSSKIILDDGEVHTKLRLIMRLRLRDVEAHQTSSMGKDRNFFTRSSILRSAEAKTHTRQAHRCAWHTHTHTKGQVPLGGHPSYGKHSWTINLISIMVTHEWNAAPCSMMANWCWYTPNVALINIGKNRELTQHWYSSLLMKGSRQTLKSLLFCRWRKHKEVTKKANSASSSWWEDQPWNRRENRIHCKTPAKCTRSQRK